MENIIKYTVNKNFSDDLYLSVQNGEVVIKAPWYYTNNQIQNIIKEKRNWIINKLKELYDNLSNSNLLDRLYGFLNNDTTYNEVIEIYYNNYLYLARLIKSLNEDVTMDEINNSINNLRNIYYSPYKTFLESSLLGEEKDIKLVFSDCYSLVSYNINTDLLDNYDDISALRDSIYKIIIYYYINMLGINIEDIEFFSIID